MRLTPVRPSLRPHPAGPVRGSRRGPGQLVGVVTVLGAVLLLVALGTEEAAGQTYSSEPLFGPLVPAGHVRFGFDPIFASWDRRFGVDADGNEALEYLSDDLTSGFGTNLFPGTATLRSGFEAVTGGSTIPLALGTTRASITKNITRLELGAHVGIFDWLTVGAMMPWVRTRTALDVLYDPAVNPTLGLNPTLEDPDAVTGYLTSLSDTEASAALRSETICGPDPTSSGCASAQAIAQRASDFAGATTQMYMASAFFLLANSSAAVAFREAQEAFVAELSEAGVSAPGDPVFSGTPVDRELFFDLPTRGDVGLVGSNLGDVNSLWTTGDMEVEAVVRVLEGEQRDSGAVHPRLAWTLAGGARVRLGTGISEDPDVFLDVGTGDGQMDMEGFAYGALRVGRWLALRASGRYGVQGSTTVERRVAPPETVLAPASSRAVLTWTPGDYLDVIVSPRIHVTETLAVAVDYRRFHKGSDRFELGNGVEGLDPTVLELESEHTAQEVAVGLRYATRALWARGETGSPFQASARLLWTPSGLGGQTPETRRVEVGIRLFRRLWGG